MAAAIIAGGAARRLGGVAKPFIEVGGRAIADRQLDILRPLFGRIFVVAADAGPWRARGLEVVADRVAGVGPLAGISAALGAAGEADGVVCVAGDLPFLSPALLIALRDEAPEADAVAPRPAGRVEPLCARYATRLRAGVDARLGAGRLALHELLLASASVWLDDSALAPLDPGGRSFFNLNTPDDLARAESLARLRP